ncbi:MAG: serine--tRNA ligase [Acidimicrobiales bacterium]
MIDVRLLLDESAFADTSRRLARKGVDPALVADTRAAALARRAAITATDDARREMNAGSTEVGRLVRDGRGDEVGALRSSLADLRARIEALEAERRHCEERFDDLVARLPNLPDDVVPDGADPSSNRVVRVHGYDAADYEGRAFRPHWEVAEALGIMDSQRAVKLSGAMFEVLRGGGARLLRGLVDLGLDLHRGRYEETVVPHMVRTEVIERTGHLTKFDTQAYRLRDDELWLLPTAEVALMGLPQGEIAEEADLPRRAMAYSVCWRREAGAAGRDTRGMQRLHEFHKVELVSLCTPETSQDELMHLLGDCEKALQVLGLPYRVVELCAGDLTFSASRVFDLEVYAPGVDRWLEVSSVSLITDFQARRGQIRFRREDGGAVELVHSLNGSGLATPRVWAAIVEHGQQADGTIRVPAALVPYVGAEVIGG